MIRIELSTSRVVGLLFITGLFCVSATLSKIVIGVAAAATKDTPAAIAPCGDAKISDLAQIDSTAIASHASQKIGGLPCDASAVPPTGFTVEQLQAGFDYFSWLTFIALNSPADGSVIGKDARPEWEKWKQLPDVMLPGGKEPTAWLPDNDVTPPPECSAQFKQGMMVIRMDMEETYNEPFKSGPLFDQNGNYALFVIFMNKAMFEYIDPPDMQGDRSKKSLYSIALQRQFQGDVNFPSGSLVNNGSSVIGPGSVMVKASWKILKPNDDATKYHTVHGLLYMPTRKQNPCQPVLLGLIGFHVGHKTATRQQWIWTTFEHVNNVPNQEDVDNGTATGTYNFYSAADKDKSHINQTPTGAWDPDQMDPQWDPQHPSSFKSQIVRTGARASDHVFDDVIKLNTAFQSSSTLSATVWKNYELVTTQWPSDFLCAGRQSPGSLPDPTCAPFPTFLANSTLETFSQPLPISHPGGNGGVPLATSSCISCHNNATTHHNPATRSDFTFILEKAQ